MQKTDFEFEILIHDDASTDGTDKIIREYQSIFNRILKPQYEKENQWTKGRRGSVVFNFPRAKGKYIAMCEGDDYWTDPLKLQKQVDFLEANPEYGLTHGNCNLFFQNRGELKKNANDEYHNDNNISDRKELFNKILKWEYLIRTATVVFRKELLFKIPKNTINFQMGDTPLWLDLSQITKFHYFDDLFCVYRILQNSASKSQIPKEQYRFQLSMFEMRVYYLKKYNYPLFRNIEILYNNALLNYLVFDPNYQFVYSLISPSMVQKIKLKLTNYYLYRKLYKYRLKKINDK